MAATVPASLKSADISRFAIRAAQLETLKPAIAYWCNYWILNQILTKNLHNVDAEALTYTTTLMDKVEQFKNANSTNDAVVDDVAARLYVEQFGLDTFTRADNEVRANKVTIRTVDIFQAAATFLDLLAVFGPIDADIATKIKYAKFHAVRILKAVRAGEDPNLSNPKQEPDPEPELPPLDPDDAEVRALGGPDPRQNQATVVEVPDEADKLQARLAKTSSLDESLHPSRDQSQARPPRPSAVEIPDEAHRLQSRLAHVSSVDESLHPSRVPSRPTSAVGGVSPLVPQDAASFYTSNQNDISPIDTTPERKPSIGGNYFPVVSGEQFKLDPEPPVLPTHPLDSPLDLPTTSAEPNLPQTPSTFTSETAPLPPAQAAAPPTEFTTDQTFVPPTVSNQPPHFAPDVLPHSTPYQQQPIMRSQAHQTQLPSLPQSQSQYQSQPQLQVRSQQLSHLQSQSQGLSSQPGVYRSPPPTYPHHQLLAPAPASAPAPAAAQPMIQSHANSSIAQPPAQQPPLQSNVVVDEEAIMKAQKHARWAISALNFEDVPTAIKELQGALAVLGAR